jgi:ribonucleoside-diphosphate reductase alpha chain
MQKGKKFLSDLKLYSDYFKWNESLGRYENWEEACENIMDSHYRKYGLGIKEYADSALVSMKDKNVLASQRTLQYRGNQLEQHNSRLYNCTSTYMARNKVFQEIFYLMLSGCGVGVGLLKPFVANLSKIQKRTLGTKTFIIPDTIEGWADALGVLMSSYFVDNQPFPEYAGYEIKFDYSLIRQKGAYISGGFKAPGSEGLRNSINKIEELINNWILTEGNAIRPILAFDILCHISNAVLSGGVRRCLPEYYEVQLADGSWKQIKDCKIGDMVLFEGKSYPINNVFDQGIQSLVKINTTEGFHVSTINHRWLVKNVTTNKIEWRTPTEILGNESNFKFLIKKENL